MQRWDIINHLIKENDYKSYLEIGYYKGWSFDNIKSRSKQAVDPNPCKDENQERLAYGTGNVLFEYCNLAVHSLIGNDFLAKMTSDEFFTELDHREKWDIIFIDGLHEATQVERDIQNSLKHLSEGGIIVLHDMLPPTLEHTTTGDKYGNWNGDCYKALLKFLQSECSIYYTVRVVNSDWGCAIITKNEEGWWSVDLAHEDYRKAMENFDYFLENKDKLFNTITPEEFLTLYTK